MSAAELSSWQSDVVGYVAGQWGEEEADELETTLRSHAALLEALKALIEDAADSAKYHGEDEMEPLVAARAAIKQAETNHD